MSGAQVTLESDFSGDFYSLRENVYVKADIDNFRQYFDKEVDVNIKLSFNLDGFWQNLFSSGDSDKTDNDWTKVQAGDHEKIEWEDPEPRCNKQVKSTTVAWIWVRSTRTFASSITIGRWSTSGRYARG